MNTTIFSCPTENFLYNASGSIFENKNERMGTMTLSTQDVAKALKENGYDEFGVAGWLDMETGSGQHLFNGKNIELSEKQVKKLSEMTKIELEHLVPIYSKEPQKKKARWTEEQKQASHHIKSIKGMSGKELSEAV